MEIKTIIRELNKKDKKIFNKAFKISKNISTNWKTKIKIESSLRFILDELDEIKKEIDLFEQKEKLPMFPKQTKKEDKTTKSIIIEKHEKLRML